MNIYWTIIVTASFFEVLWVIGLKHANSPLEWIGTIFGILITFVLLSFASKRIPIGTMYTVFVGLGTMGTFLSDALLFGLAIKTPTVLFLLLLLSGIIGLKIVTQKEETLSRGLK